MSQASSLEIVFVRHGRRTYAQDFKHKDADDPLDKFEHHAVATRRGILENTGVCPSRVFVSSHQHARDTARILCKKAELLSEDGVPVTIAPELTPKSGTDIDEMFARIACCITSSMNLTFMLVGHDPR